MFHPVLSNCQRGSILFLDDDPDRVESVRNSYGSFLKNRFVWVQTSGDAIAELTNYGFSSGNCRKHYDVVCLDYDLAPMGWLSPQHQLNNGMRVVEYIVANSDKFMDTKFLVHSMNPDYGPQMAEALRIVGLDVTYSCFGTGEWSR